MAPEEKAKWIEPRPLYMRELEPLAHDEAWPSPYPTVRVNPEEQLANRKKFLEGKRFAKSIEAVREEQQKKPG
jgi:hypothetical protein